MPTKRVRRAWLSSSQTSDTQAADLHASFWEAAGGDATNYRSLRSAVMRGMLDDSGVVLNVRNTYSYELACA